MEVKSKPDFSSKNLAHYEIKFNLLCPSASMRKNVRRKERKLYLSQEYKSLNLKVNL